MPQTETKAGIDSWGIKLNNINVLNNIHNNADDIIKEFKLWIEDIFDDKNYVHIDKNNLKKILIYNRDWFLGSLNSFSSESALGDTIISSCD